MFLTKLAAYASLLERNWGSRGMVAFVSTVAFEGIEAKPVDVQVQIAPGLAAFIMLCRINSFKLLRNKKDRH